MHENAKLHHKTPHGPTRLEKRALRTHCVWCLGASARHTKKLAIPMNFTKPWKQKPARHIQQPSRNRTHRQARQWTSLHTAASATVGNHKHLQKALRARQLRIQCESQHRLGGAGLRQEVLVEKRCHDEYLHAMKDNENGRHVTLNLSAHRWTTGLTNPTCH